MEATMDVTLPRPNPGNFWSLVCPSTIIAVILLSFSIPGSYQIDIDLKSRNNQQPPQRIRVLIRRNPRHRPLQLDSSTRHQQRER